MFQILVINTGCLLATAVEYYREDPRAKGKDKTNTEDSINKKKKNAVGTSDLKKKAR